MQTLFPAQANAPCPNNSLHVTIVHDQLTGLENFDYGLRRIFLPGYDFYAFGRELRQQVPSNTLLFTEDDLGVGYLMYRPTRDRQGLFIVGPYLPVDRVDEEALCADAPYWVGRVILKGYYDRLMHIQDSERFYHTAASLLPHGMDTVQVRHTGPLGCLCVRHRADAPPLDLGGGDEELLDLRRRAEDELMHAVSRSDVDQALSMVHWLYQLSAGQDLRTVKNHLLGLNALLRKSVELSGVPLSLCEALYQKYCQAIEAMDTSGEPPRFLPDMAADYCGCVGRCSRRDYSPLTQKVVAYINQHPDAPLSLRMLADKFSVNPSYLSELFRQNVGMTLTDYINAQRVREAKVLLSTTGDSIVNIAARVGMMDANYFSRLFKRSTGLTPSQYRRQRSEAQQP